MKMPYPAVWADSGDSFFQLSTGRVIVWPRHSAAWTVSGGAFFKE